MRKILIYILLLMSVCAIAQTSNPDDDYETGAYYYENGDYKNAFRYFMSAAKAGDSNAQNAVGDMYMNGKGVTKSYTNALQWYLKAAEQDHFYAQNSLGDLYYSGEGVKQDYLKAYKWYLKAAEQGLAIAQNELATLYWYGKGTKQDYLKAIEWYSKAAEQGLAAAQYNLGRMYYCGNGVGKDYLKAYEWISKAAEQGVGRAQSNLGKIFYRGDGVQKNINKAEEWFLKSLNNGEDDSSLYSYLSLIYAQRDKDYNKALEYSDKAINKIDLKNDSRSDQSLIYGRRGLIYQLKGDFTNAEKCFNRCLELNPEYTNEDEDFAKVMDNHINNDTDSNIFTTEPTNRNTFAIVIGNENYKHEVDVPYANNDAKVFGKYVEKTLGVPHDQIKVIENAGYNDLRIATNWLVQAMQVCHGKGIAIVYYAGHGIPDESDQSSYLLPVDGIGNDPGSAFSLTDLYKKLGEVEAQSITVFLDACFSGSKREEGMLTSARGVAIKARQSAPQGNMIVFSAAQGDETAYPYKDMQHGLFTYFLLKKLKETKGEVTLGELSEYLSDEVGRQSFLKNNKLQTPTVSVAPSLQNSWKSIKLK